MREKDYVNVDLYKILKGIVQLYEVSQEIEIQYPNAAMLGHVNKVALTQVFLNLICNGLKFNKKKIPKSISGSKRQKIFTNLRSEIMAKDFWPRIP